ncbi:MAG: DNA adenine methylase, partial [Pseudobdellovibrionaceae bacterium]
EKKPKNTLEQAFQTIIRNRVSHGGIMAPGSGLIKSGENGKGLTSRWYPQTLAKRISEIENVKDRLTIIHGSAFDVIPDYSGSPKNAIFIDPPYTAGGKKAGQRLYRHHEMDHAGLFDLMDQSKADFLFTYDESDELKSLAQRHGFDTALIAMKNTHHAKMDELIVGRNLTWLKEK